MGTTRGRAWRGFTVAVTAALAAGCTSAGAGEPTPAPAGPESVSPPARFYRQVLKWDLCEEFLCARLTVPIDYAPPEHGTFSLPLIGSAVAQSRQFTEACLKQTEVCGGSGG